jgi:hypothetical protein
MASEATTATGGCPMILYLLGFPTPVIEIIVLLAGVVIFLAIAFGLRFETVDMDERPSDDEAETEATG